MIDPRVLYQGVDAVRAHAPLIHCITNYVTVNDCANALLASGASPIMSDEEDDVEDITGLCQGLVINIGTLNQASIEGMYQATAVAERANKPIVLDPVGAGASRLRTSVACELVDERNITLIRANMSEIKALAGASSSTQGVDVNPADVVSEHNLSESVAFVRSVAEKTSAIIAVTGAIDIVSDGARAFVIKNGSPLMGKITGAGCMLSCLSGAYLCANTSSMLEATVAAVSAMGVAGEIAEARMGVQDGNGSYRTYLLDALFNMSSSTLEEHAKIECVSER